MNIFWRYSNLTEKQRIVFTCNSLARGTYKVLNFYILPEPTKKPRPDTVYLPDFQYDMIPQFWQKMKKKELYIGERADTDITQAIKQKVSSLDLLSIQTIRSVQTQWKEKEKPFKQFLAEIFPQINTKIRDIVICPTRFGTEGSYSGIMSKKVHMYLRFDSDISVLAKLFILTVVSAEILPPKPDELSIIKDQTWYVKDRIGQFLLNNSRLTQIFPSLKQKHLYTKSVHLLKKSQRYLKDLGFGDTSSLIIKNGKAFNALKKRSLDSLTQAQQEILKVLIGNRGKVVSFEEIGKRLWGNKVDKKYSLYAITKISPNFERPSITMASTQTSSILSEEKGMHYMTNINLSGNTAQSSLLV